MQERTNAFFQSRDGTSLYYETHGTGEPIILVYGIACLINHFHHQIEHFSKTHQVIVPDLRGHNRSQVPRDLSTMKIEILAEDLLDLMNHLKIKKAHFVGHSFGVPLLLNLASKYPDRILSLAFINGFAKNPVQGMFGVDLAEKFFHFAKKTYGKVPFLWSPLWRLAIQTPVAQVAASLLGGFNIKKSEWKDVEIYSRAIAEMSLDMFLPLFEDMMSFNGESLAEKVRAKTLVLAGDSDFVTPLSYQLHLHELVRGSRYVVVPRGSHCTQLDFPKLVNTEIEKGLST
jgi:pimeloyl-ACP methyl ester carboxylesterase